MTNPGATPAAPAWWRTLGREHWHVFGVTSLAWLFDCLDSQFFNLAREGAMDDLLTDRRLATEYGPYTTAVFLLGWAVGGLVFGALGDRLGRARMLAMTVLLYSLCTGLSAFATSFTDFCVYRFVTGLGIGGVFGLAVALIADSLPDRARAPALGLFQSLSTWGNLAAALIGMSIGAYALRHGLPWHLQPWRVLFLVGAAPALLSVLAIRRLPEPAKWRQAKAAGEARGIQAGSYRHLLKHPRWRRHAWLALVLCTAGIIGLWGVGNFHPRIVGAVLDSELAGQGRTPEQLASAKAFWGSLGVLLQNIGGFCGMLTLARFAQTHGRRVAAVLSLLLSFATTLLVFRYLRHLSQMYWMLPLMGFGQLSVLAVYAIYLPELFPTGLRSTGTSFCYNFGRLIAATAPFTVGRITRSLGGQVEAFRTAGMCVSVLLLAGVVVVPFLPETKGQPLPEET